MYKCMEKCHLVNEYMCCFSCEKVEKCRVKCDYVGLNERADECDDAIEVEEE